MIMSTIPYTNGDKVKFMKHYRRIVCDEMKKYIEEHKDRIYTVEKTDGDCVKLYRVGFWISNDLLETD